jgi:hypothetical protein
VVEEVELSEETMEVASPELVVLEFPALSPDQPCTMAEEEVAGVLQQLPLEPEALVAVAMAAPGMLTDLPGLMVLVGEVEDLVVTLLEPGMVVQEDPEL